MIRVTIRNFQSIEDQTLEIDRFTVITGRSNIGKSAVIRAISGLLRNSSVGAFVRHSNSCPRVTKGVKTCRCACSVTFSTETHTIVWEKGEGTNRYTVDGVLYDKAERGYPPFLAPLGLDPIPLGSDFTLVQVSDQWDPLFLFNRSASEVATVIGDVGELPKVQEAIKAIERDRKDTASRKKIREEDLKTTQESLESFQDVPVLQAKLAEMQKMRDRLYQLSSVVNVLREFQDRLQSLTESLEESERKANTVLSSPPSSDEFQRIVGWGFSYQEIQAHLLRLSSLSEITLPSFPDPERLDRLKGFYDRFVKNSDIPRVPEIPTTLPEGSAVYLSLLSLRDKVAPVQEAYLRAKASASELSAESRAIQEEIASIPVCPTCGNPTSGEDSC